MSQPTEMTLQELVEAFSNLYPTEFKHALAEARASKLAQRLAELEASDLPTDEDE